MSNIGEIVFSDDVQEEIKEQAQTADIPAEVSVRHECTDDDRVQCATSYGPKAVENKILISISENINTMAEAIKESEDQKRAEREKCITFFKRILVFLICVTAVLIGADTFFGIAVRIEFLVSVILAILADVFAIVHTLVKYMTNTENYDAYGKLIDSLLKHINHK